MRTIPGEILEAARMDGCSEFRVYRQIMMPLTLPAMAALATLEFTWIFNDFLWALILIQDDKLKPVTTGLAALRGQYVMDWTVIVAGLADRHGADHPGVPVPATLLHRWA